MKRARPPYHRPHELSQADETYLRLLREKGVRTARHASEEIFSAPDPEVTRAVVVSLRRVIGSIFDSDTTRPEIPVGSHEAVAGWYWEGASQADPKHGAIEGHTLNDYFTVGERRDYESIIEHLRERHCQTSVTSSFVDGVEAYASGLGIDTTDATRLLVQSMQQAMPTLQADTMLLCDHSGYSRVEATNATMNDFTSSLAPAHVEFITADSRFDPALIGGLINKPRSWIYDLVRNAELSEQRSVLPPLAVTEEDARGLITAYTLQTRPYSAESLRMAAEMAKNQSIQLAFMLTHLGLVEQSRDYFRQHPERARCNLEPYSEVFVPAGDGIVPNPKLIKAFVNNFLPAIAATIAKNHRRPDEVTSEDILSGVEDACRLRFFQLHVGQFNRAAESDVVELKSFFSATCPGSQMISKALRDGLPRYFEAAQRLESPST